MVTAVKGGGGEVVQVHGGHIIRSTAGKKDRHSKVYTAKGARDRRVRLAAHTAIQFYDVQDRLGYDHPSKAVDWLMEKAKHAIDMLDQLPPFDPNAVNNNNNINGVDMTSAPEQNPPEIGLEDQSMGFGSGYPHQDLCLSLQSFQNGSGFEPVPEFPAGWSSDTNTQAEMGRFSRLLAWSDRGGGGLDQSSFHPQPSIRAWDDLPVGPTWVHPDQHSDRFTGFFLPPQVGGGGGDQVHRMMVAQAHHHHGASSMSTNTDSSH